MTRISNAPPGREPSGADTESVVAAQFDDRDNKPGSDLLQEFAKAAGKAAQPEPVAWLGNHRIGKDIIFGPHCSIVGVERIEIDGPQYQPIADGHPAIVTPVSYDYGSCALDPIDLVAWPPAEPCNVYLRTGIADILNPAAVERAASCSEPLILHLHPLAWLQHDMAGAVILNWRACIRFLLGGIDRVIVTDQKLLWQLTNKLNSENLARSPEIRIARETSHAA